MARRAILVGEAPKVGGDPKYPLAGLVSNSSGARLRAMSGISKTLWFTSVRRVNVVSRLVDGKFPLDLARDNAANLSGSLFRGERLILCGRRVAAAFALSPQDYNWMEWVVSPLGPTVAVIPHASGRNRLYNDAALAKRVGVFLKNNL